MFGGRNTVADQLIEISDENADSMHIRSKKYVKQYSEESDKAVFVAVSGVADDGYRIAEIGYDMGLSAEDELLGFVMCGSFQYNEYDDYMYAELDSILSNIGLSRSDFPVFSIHSISVKTESIGSGVVEDLVSTVLDSEYSHSPFLSSVWEHSPVVGESSIFSSESGMVSDYYPNWSCPKCRGSCECSVMFFTR